MKISILYLTYDGLSYPLGQSQILPYLEGLAALGHPITIISFQKVKAAGRWFSAIQWNHNGNIYRRIQWRLID
ncbi:MAG: hypothetical protein U5K79_15505 [Cyclobacteriaceae bacterium]|nr:hypothetical protein [Cyclobacteriaceae bacterium]